MSTDIPDLPWNSLPITDTLPDVRSVGSVWRRLAAYVMDGIILGIVGVGIGTALFDKLSRLGPWGRLVGFCIALVYFTFFDSEIGDGQTFGKRLLKLRVINAQGNTISFAKSLLRSAIFIVPSFLYGLRLPETRTPWIVSAVVFVVVLWVGGSTLYLIIFDRNSRQGLHDLFVGSYVSNADDTGPVGTTPMAKEQWAILGVLLVIISVTAGVLNAKLEKTTPFPQMRQDAELIERMDGVQKAHLRDRLSHGSADEGAKKTLVISVILKSKFLNQEAFADEIARDLLQGDPNAQNYDQLSIRLFRGYDIGIAQRWNHQEFAHAPSEWRHRVLDAPPAQTH